MITASGYDAPGGPASAIIATVTRRNEHSPLAGCKCLNFLDNILARQEAEKRGADEALLLNTAGRLAEASAANLFLVLGAEPPDPALGRRGAARDHAGRGDGAPGRQGLSAGTR